MTFTYKYTGTSSQVRRTFACDECNIEFSMWQSREDAIPDCPYCELQAQKAITVPNILTNKSRAVDFAQDTMEAMGYTDFNDNQRPGDIAAKAPSPMMTAEREQMYQREAELARAMEVPKLSEAPQVPGGISQAEMGHNFWGSGGIAAPPGMPQPVAQALTGSALVGAKVARAEGFDPIQMLHEKKPPFKLDVVAATDRRTGNRRVK